MKNRNKIMQEIRDIGLQVKVVERGLVVYPNKDDDNHIWTAPLEELLLIAQKYGLGHYIDFTEGYVRLH